MVLNVPLFHPVASSFSRPPIWGLVEDEKKINRSPLPRFSFVLVFSSPYSSSSESVSLQLQTVLHPNWTHYSPCSVDTSFSLELPLTLSSNAFIYHDLSCLSGLRLQFTFSEGPSWQARIWSLGDLQSPFWGLTWLCLDPAWGCWYSP